jgi:hypothetical protein
LTALLRMAGIGYCSDIREIASLDSLERTVTDE